MNRIYQTALAASAVLLIACSSAETPDIKTADITEAASQAPSKAASKIDGMGTAVKAAAPAAMETKTKAVLIYADWCGSCKILDPKLKYVRAGLGENGTMPGLEFVTLNYTDKNADNFYAQAEASGVSEAVKTYLDGTIKTGQLLLVDMDDQTVVGKVTKTFEAADIMTALKDAISAS